MTAPRPSVALSRKTLRGKRSPGAGSGIAASPSCAGRPGPAERALPRRPRARDRRTRRARATSRAQRTPQTTRITAPIATATQLTISPTRRQTTPTAKPIGQRLGGGSCRSMSPRGSSTRRASPSLVGSISRWIQSCRILRRQRRNNWRNASGALPRPYSSQRASTRARTSSLIANLLRPGPRTLGRALVSGVDPDLAAVELHRGRVVEVVERPLGEQHVPLRVDVRADPEEDLLVVVHVDRTRRRPRPPSSGSAGRGPRSRASPSAPGPG